MCAETATEIRDLVATRNRPMLTALEMCIEQLEAFSDDPSVANAITCARIAIKLERTFQSSE